MLARRGVRGHIDEFYKAYEREVFREYGAKNVVSADLPKTMPVSFRPDFKSEHSAERHGAAAAFSKIIETRLLNDPQHPPADTVKAQMLGAVQAVQTAMEKLQNVKPV